MVNRVYVAGVGMTRFEKPSAREWDYPDMAREAGTAALEDAGIDYSEVEQGYVGYVYGESTSGQRALYELGMTGIPVVNVNNNCSTGSTALYLAAQAVRGARRPSPTNSSCRTRRRRSVPGSGRNSLRSPPSTTRTSSSSRSATAAGCNRTCPRRSAGRRPRWNRW